MKKEITRENITETDLEFLNEIVDQFEATHGTEISELSKIINELMRESFTFQQAFIELNEHVQEYKKDTTLKEFRFDEVFRIIDYNSNGELVSSYLNDTIWKVQETSNIIDIMSKYFLEKQLIRRINYEKLVL